MHGICRAAADGIGTRQGRKEEIFTLPSKRVRVKKKKQSLSFRVKMRSWEWEGLDKTCLLDLLQGCVCVWGEDPLSFLQLVPLRKRFIFKDKGAGMGSVLKCNMFHLSSLLRIDLSNLKDNMLVEKTLLFKGTVCRYFLL